MKLWLMALPALGLLLSGCGRTQPVQEAAPGPRTKPALRIVFAEPSPGGDRLVIGLGFGQPSRSPRQVMLRPQALWLVDLRTGKARTLPSDLSSDLVLSWRPDGGALVSTTPAGRVEVHDLARGASRIVSPEGMYCRGPVWSPDGSRLVVEATTDVHRRPTAGKRTGTHGEGEMGRRTAAVSERYEWALGAGPMSVYTLPADGSAPPRLEADARGGDVWYWNAEVARLLSPRARRRDAAATTAPRRRVLMWVRSAHVLRCSPDRSKLAFSVWDNRRGGAAVVVLDRSLVLLVQRQGLEAPAERLLWSPDGTRLLARTSADRTYLLDVAARTTSVVDDPVVAEKEPVGWVQWSGKLQVVFIDEASERLVVTERMGAPAYTLVALQEDGTPALVLPRTEEK